jgi:dipeptidyl aminopeptidase/acylaminoacyl peptidase
VFNDGGRGRIAAVDAATGEARPAPDVGDGLAGGVAVDDAGRVFFTLSRVDAPPRVVRWEPGAAAIVPLTFPDLAGVPASALPAAPRLVEYPSFDGTKIPAWLYLPRGKQAKGLPFVVSYHGGPEGQDRPWFSPERAYLLAHGYGILAPNVRGSTGYGRTWRDADNYKRRMDSVRDGKAAVDWLLAEGLAAPGRVAAMGGSYGGFMVLALLTEFPDAFAAGVEVVGIANFETFLERTADYRRALREAEYGPLADREFLRAISPIHKVDRITAALLVGHGERDPRVPVGEARQIERAMKARGRPVLAQVFPDEGHGFSKRANRRVWMRTVAEFLRDHVGG